MAWNLFAKNNKSSEEYIKQKTQAIESEQKKERKWLNAGIVTSLAGTVAAVGSLVALAVTGGIPVAVSLAAISLVTGGVVSVLKGLKHHNNHENMEHGLEDFKRGVDTGATELAREFEIEINKKFSPEQISPEQIKNITSSLSNVYDKSSSSFTPERKSAVETFKAVLEMNKDKGAQRI